MTRLNRELFSTVDLQKQLEKKHCSELEATDAKMESFKQEFITVLDERDYLDKELDHVK